MSINKAQAALLAEGLLNRLGESKVDLDKYVGVEEILALFGKDFIANAQANLQKSNSISTGKIADIKMVVTKFGTKYSVSLGYPDGDTAAKYYDFINKGVKGTKGGSSDAGYAFKNSNPNRRMAASIFSWLNTGRKKVGSDKYVTNASEKKSKRLKKMLTEAENKRKLAYAVATSIKTGGIKKTRYFDKAVKETFGKNFYDAMYGVLGKNIQIQVKKIVKEEQNGNNTSK